MWLLAVLEGVIIAFIFLIIVTQVIVPLLAGTALFPFLRKDFRKLDTEMREVETSRERKEIERRIRKARKELQNGVNTYSRGEEYEPKKTFRGSRDGDNPAGAPVEFRKPGRKPRRK